MTGPLLVLVETDSQEATETSLETLTFARDLAGRLGEVPLHAVLVGQLDAAVRATTLAQLGNQGVAVVHHAEHERPFGVLRSGLGQRGRRRGCRVVGRGATGRRHTAGQRGPGTRRDPAQHADGSQVVAVADATAGEPLVVSRQVMGGSVHELMRLDATPAVLTVAGHAVEPTSASAPTEPEVRGLTPELQPADLVGRVVRVEESEADDTAALTSARVVVGAGRGAGSANGFDDLLELTGLLGGHLGVSRVVTSLGWRPHAEQVGQTGSRISPDIYIACGISGAIQHWAGCSSAKTILAINTDEDAPMVTKAHYAVIGDLHEIVPAVNEELRRRTA